MIEYYMLEALKEAKKCKSSGDVPIGAVIVYNNKIIARAKNEKNKKNCAIFHAEIIAIKKASKVIKDFRLEDCDIYVTKEPCLMCMGAILSARINKIYFGAYDKKYGNSNLAKENNFNHKCDIIGGVKEEECSKILEDFFKNLRA